MNDCIQMAQIQTFQGLIQPINVYVVVDESQITLRCDSALRKLPELFDGGSECVLLDDSTYIIPTGEMSGCNALMRQPLRTY